MEATILYEKAEKMWIEYDQFIIDMIHKNDVKMICEIGGGANPLLSAEYIQATGIEYYILDISETELSKAPNHCNKIVADIAAPDFSFNTTKFDMVFSKMLAEHIKDGEQFHKNVIKMLTDRGSAVHYFPTLYTLPFLINYLVPETLAAKLLKWFASRDSYQYAKFPAYYSWCRGPTRNQLSRLESLGYEIVEYRGGSGIVDTTIDCQL